MKRKIVHKIAERFCVSRDVAIKHNDIGDMMLTKCEQSAVPSLSLTEIINRRKAEKDKNVADPLVKRKIFTRNKGNEQNCMIFYFSIIFFSHILIINI